MATKELTYNDQPIEVFAKSAPRCSQCGAARVRRDDGSFGACTNIECKNPVADYARENGLENPFHCGGEVDRDGLPRPRPVYPPAVPVCGHETGGPQPIVKALDDDLPDAGDLNDATHGSCATDPCGKPGCSERTLKVYVASSWRNTFQPEVVKALRAEGFTVYDFKDAEGFSWREVDPEWANWTPPAYLCGLGHACAERGFNRDMTALRECDLCVYVMPCGPSASMEMGWAIGAGKPTAAYIPAIREPELMVKMADFIHHDWSEILRWVRASSQQLAARS